MANTNSLAEDKLRKFVDAVEMGVQFLVNHPQESWQLFIKGDRKDLDDQLNRRGSLSIIRQIFAGAELSESCWLGWLNKKGEAAAEAASPWRGGLMK